MGVKFFLPDAADAEMAERQYALFIQDASAYGHLRPEARVYSLVFHHNGEPYQATVGEPIAGWRDPVGRVLAIVESRQLVYVHTERGVVRGNGPILAGHPNDCRDRQWFEDFPPRRQQQP